MMMRTTLYAVVNALVLTLFVASTQALAIEVTVKKKFAVVRDAPVQQGTVLSKYKKGDVIEALKRTGTYWQVKTEKGKIGYISIFKVKRTNSQNSSFAKALRKAVKSDRTTDAVNNVRTRSSVMGVRGLSDSENTAFASNVRPNHMVVYEMEDAAVSAKRVRRMEFSVQKELMHLQRRRSMPVPGF